MSRLTSHTSRSDPFRIALFSFGIIASFASMREVAVSSSSATDAPLTEPSLVAVASASDEIDISFSVVNAMRTPSTVADSELSLYI